MMNKALLLDDFNHGDLSKYEMNHHFVSSYHLSFCEEVIKYGEKSLKLTYDFSGWKSGNGAMYIQFNDELKTEKRPLKLGVWVYGDGKSPWLRAALVDGSGEVKIVNLTKGNIDWYGWKYVDVAIDGKWELPIRLQQIYAVETDKTKQGNKEVQGSIYFDQLRFVYIDDVDLKGPDFCDVKPQKQMIYTNAFLFSVKVFDDETGVDESSICMKINGKQVQHRYDSMKHEIKYFLYNLPEGTYHIEVDAKDNMGNAARPMIHRSYTIDLTKDLDPPVISNITPTEAAICPTSTPRITFHVVDEKSGIAVEDIQVILNGTRLPVMYDEESGWCYTYSKKHLSNGRHQFTITVKDRAGNRLGPIQNEFHIQSNINLQADHLSISIVPDTHTTPYAAYAFQKIKEEASHLIIHMGDMVDQGEEWEFVKIKKALRLVEETMLLTTPGNHESFQGNLDLYMHYFGSPTYHVECAHVLCIVLNTAYEQSLSKSDATQFHYLESLLRENKKENILLMTHVPTMDSFGTSHHMNEKDARLLENLLGRYKLWNPQVNITVLFGHLHILQTWQKDGVNYLITGNGAGKGYVSHEKGNILGYGVVDIKKDSMIYQFRPFVNEIFIGFGDNRIACLDIDQYASIQLRVYGHFDVIDSKYHVDLSGIDMICIDWLTEDPTILSISEQGIIYGKSCGKTTITARMDKHQVTIPVEVRASRDS